MPLKPVSTIRNKMLMGFLAISLIPIVLIAVTAIIISRNALTSQGFARMENLRELKKNQVTAYMEERQTDLAMLMETVDSLRHAAFDKLKTVQENKKAQVEQYFLKVFSDMDVISNSITVVRAIDDFSSTLDESGKRDTLLYDFFENEKYGATLYKFSMSYGYYDFLLVTPAGRVVYSSRRESDLGENLSLDPWRETGIGACFSRALGGRGVMGRNFQDFESYPPSNGRHLAFLGSPIRDKSGGIKGVVILKLDDMAVNEVALRRQGMGVTGETYIAGMRLDAGMRSGSIVLKTARPVQGGRIGETVDDPYIEKALESAIPPFIRVSDAGISEIVAYDPVRMPGINWVLVTSLDLAEVIDPRVQSRTKDYFSKYIQAYGYSKLYLISPEGLLFYSARHGTEIKARQINLKGMDTGLGRLYDRIVRTRSVSYDDFTWHEPEQAPFAYLGRPFMDGDRVELVVALQMPITGINTLMGAAEHPGIGAAEQPGGSTDIYLVGPDRLLRSDTYLEPMSHSVAALFSKPGQKMMATRAAQKALDGETGITTAGDYRGKEVLAAFAPMQVLGSRWGIVAKMDKKEALASLDLFAALVALACLITTAVIIRASLVMSKRVARPIMALKTAAEQVKKHNFNIRVDITTRDELMLLAEAFNAMVATIQKYSVSLEQKIAELEMAEGMIRKSEERFRNLVETTSDWIWEIDTDFNYTYVSPKVRDILGYDPGEVLGKTPFDFMPDETESGTREDFSAMTQVKAVFDHLEVQFAHRDGRLITLETSGVPILDKQERLLGYRGIDRDVSKRKKIEAELMLSESVFTNTIEGIAITDRSGTIQRVNTAFTDITGYTAEEAIGQNPSILKSNRHDKTFYREMWKQLLDAGQWSGEIWNRRKDGSAYPEWLSISSIRDQNGRITHFISLFHDISEKKLKEEQLQFLAFHDPLTKLPNRKLFYDRASVSLSASKRANRKMALLYMDMDNFKDINDTYGHPFGDEFLCRVKDRISTICRESDTFARYGGDEFVIVLNDISNSDEVAGFAKRIINLFKEPLKVMDEEVFSSVSIGVAIFPEDGEDIVTLEKNADMALYEAKKDGKRQCFLFQQTLREKLERKTRIENELRRAIKDFSDFTIYYQPKVDIVTNRIHGVEALLRWICKGEFISPGEFIPIAEETNTIIPIGEWLMEQAMNDITQIHTAGFDSLSLSINLSSKQFNDDQLFDKISTILGTTGFDRSMLCFEITESIPMKNIESAIRIMDELSRMGIQLSLDDFGTGYSSLGYLKQFPIQELKIDRSFVKDIPWDQNDAAISKATIKMAKSLNFNVVAEGVETDDQLNFLRSNGCRLIQGFYFFKPMPIDELTQSIEEFHEN